jgi:hypothetical protein
MLLRTLIAAVLVAAAFSNAVAGPALVAGPADVPHRGVYEVALEAAADVPDPYLGATVQVTFTRPDGSKATVDAFYDGGRTFKARAYADAVGAWSWASSAQAAGLGGRRGTFKVVPSALKGKLRKHPDDPRQFACDDGTWFLHIGDTGYRYVTATEPRWKEYIDQAARMGATKIRTWFCQSRGGVEALFADGRRGLALAYWQEIDRRVRYALEAHPQVQLKLILYGEDTAELARAGQGDALSLYAARYAQARWSAMPNVHWCISNDREIVRGEAKGGRRVSAATIDRIGREMAAREPWGTLLTNHQLRFGGYDFVDAPWSDIVTLEDLDQVHGAKILEYRPRGDDPVVNDEDRYELYKPPAHPRYFFRRLMWASILSGGHATYGGLRTYEPYDGDTRGVSGYFDAKAAGKLAGGADDFVHIHTFFREAGLTPVGMQPDDACVGGDLYKWKALRGADAIIVYLANPTGTKPESDDAAPAAPAVTVRLPAGAWAARWFQPTTGRWTDGGRVAGAPATLKAPGGGDWVLVLRRTAGG